MRGAPNLSLLLLLLVLCTPLDAQRDLAELRSRAETGDAAAQFNLGRLHVTGSGVPQDDHEAARWYRLAAEQGYAPAQHSLGLRYDAGLGVEENDAEALLTNATLRYLSNLEPDREGPRSLGCQH